MLELLKASGWQTGAVGFAMAAFLGLTHIGTIPAPEPIWIAGAWVLMLVCFALSIASTGPLIQAYASSKLKVRRRRQAEADAERRFREYIPYLTEDERNILGYLLTHRQKLFTAPVDGGYANTLVSQGFVIRLLRPGQSAPIDDIPMGVADHVWKVMEKNPEKFEYEPNMDRGVETHPWRVPW